MLTACSSQTETNSNNARCLIVFLLEGNCNDRINSSAEKEDLHSKCMLIALQTPDLPGTPVSEIRCSLAELVLHSHSQRAVLNGVGRSSSVAGRASAEGRKTLACSRCRVRQRKASNRFYTVRRFRILFRRFGNSALTPPSRLHAASTACGGWRNLKRVHVAMSGPEEQHDYRSRTFRDRQIVYATRHILDSPGRLPTANRRVP